MRRGLLPALLVLLAAPGVRADDVVTKRVGRLTISVDTRWAHPGGLFVVDFRSAERLGRFAAIFEGRRSPAEAAPAGPRALVPIPLDTPAGSWTLGVELRTRSGLQHLTLAVPVAGRTFPVRHHALDEAARARVDTELARRDGRRLLVALRERTPAPPRRGALRPPLAVAPSAGFGSHEDHGGVPVERISDGTWGERQRALEYPVEPGAPVGAPAGGSVVLAESLAATGGTLVIDHGEGLVSALYPLDRLTLVAGDEVAAGQRVGSAASSPLGGAPRLEWALQLHGIAVDPLDLLAFGASAEPASAPE